MIKVNVKFTFVGETVWILILPSNGTSLVTVRAGLRIKSKRILSVDKKTMGYLRV